MPDDDSTHAAAEKTKRGAPLEPPTAPKPAGTGTSGPQTPGTGEGPPHQIKPDGR